MRQEFSVLRFCIGDADILEHILDLPADEPFSNSRIAFLNEVSRTLVSDQKAKEYPDVMTFAFLLIREFCVWGVDWYFISRRLM